MLGVHPMRAWQPDARVASPLDEARAVVRRAAAPPAVADILPLDSLCRQRVVQQAAGERSYHIMYSLCDSTMGEKLGLKHPSAHRLLRGSSCFEVEGRNEAAEHARVERAMDGLGFSRAEIAEIFEYLAAILLAGDLEFAPLKPAADSTPESPTNPKPESAGLFGALRQFGRRNSRAHNTVAGAGLEEPGCALQDQEAAARVAKLWKVTPSALGVAFTRRSIEVRGETSEIALRPREAVDGCAAAAKNIYGALFAHIVSRINELLDGPRGAVVGILDIFGFEIFESNSFEQASPTHSNNLGAQLFALAPGPWPPGLLAPGPWPWPCSSGQASLICCSSSRNHTTAVAHDCCHTRPLAPPTRHPPCTADADHAWHR